MLVGFVWCVIVLDKWSSTPLSMTYIFDPFVEHTKSQDISWQSGNWKLLHIKWNLPTSTITNPNGFKIGPSTTVIRGVSKVSWTLNNPVLLHQLFFAKSQAKYLHPFRASASNQLTPSCRWGQDWKSSWIPHQSLSTYVFTDFDIRKNLDIM